MRETIYEKYEYARVGLVLFMMRMRNGHAKSSVAACSARTIAIALALMLAVGISTTGMVAAQTHIEKKRAVVTGTVEDTAKALNDDTSESIDSFFEAIKFLKAPNVKGLKIKTAEKKLETDFEVKVKHKKMKFEELAEESDTLFFGEVKAQSQSLDEVTIEVADPDMSDPLTAEMVNFGGRLAWPVPGSTIITSRFGGRASPGGIGSTDHKGIDIAGRTGAPVIAAKEGEITTASRLGGYGNCVIIKHDNGYETLYGHLSVITCNVGDKVKPGDVIGRVGSTGASTGPHLHFGIRKDGTFVNPEPYLTGRNYIEAGSEVSENAASQETPTEAEKQKALDKKEETKDGKTPEKGEAGREDKKDPAEPSVSTPEKDTEPATQPTTQPPSTTQPTTQPPSTTTTQPTTQPPQNTDTESSDE